MTAHREPTSCVFATRSTADLATFSRLGSAVSMSSTRSRPRQPSSQLQTHATNSYRSSLAHMSVYVPEVRGMPSCKPIHWPSITPWSRLHANLVRVAQPRAPMSASSFTAGDACRFNHQEVETGQSKALPRRNVNVIENDDEEHSDFENATIDDCENSHWPKSASRSSESQM